MIRYLQATFLAAMVPAQAGDTTFPLNDAEKAAWCGLETAMAAVGDIIEHQGCEETVGRYNIGMDILWNGNGTGFVDNVDLTIALVERSTKGEKFEVTGNGDLDNIVLDPDELRVLAIENGEIRQDYPVSDMIYSPRQIVSMISRYQTLVPGDLIVCGTSVGASPMERGCEIQVSIPGLGTLVNHFDDRPE